jgi:DNA modification methylase
MNEIILGDCLDILPTIKENFIIVTDPPFNIGYHYKNYTDNMDEDDYYS